MGSGELRLFGGVVRDNAGEIVVHLREVSRSIRQEHGEGKFAIAAALGVAAVAATAGGVYLLYRRYSRKGKALATLEAVDSTMTAYLAHGIERDITPGDVEALAAALETFLDLRRKPEFSDVQIRVSNDVYEKLRDFLRSLRAFNEAAHEQLPALPKPPAAITNGGSLDLLLDELLGQVRYQESALDVVRAA